MSPQPEPWLRGPIEGVPSFAAPLFHSFQQAREDLARITESLTPHQLWHRPAGAAPVGFHIRHAGGAADRLCTYLEGRQLTEAQMERLRAEMNPGATREQLLAELDADFKRVEAVVAAMDPARLTDLRTVGRKLLPTTVIGLIVHIAEHTQRHTGQAITTARIAATVSPDGSPLPAPPA